jgi:hypothetical protein
VSIALVLTSLQSPIKFKESTCLQISQFGHNMIVEKFNTFQSQETATQVLIFSPIDHVMSFLCARRTL